jgi:hypothetical protein
MRSHGVPEFPDPDVLNGRTHVRVAAGQIDPNSPIVTAAVAACRSKLAGGGISADNLVQGAAGQGKGQVTRSQRGAERAGAFAADEGRPSVRGSSPRPCSATSPSSNRSRPTGFGTLFVHNVPGAP